LEASSRVGKLALAYRARDLFIQYLALRFQAYQQISNRAQDRRKAGYEDQC